MKKLLLHPCDPILTGFANLRVLINAAKWMPYLHNLHIVPHVSTL